MVCPERILAMKLGFAFPIVGSAVSSAAGLSAFCRGLEDLGYDTLWVLDRLVTPVAMHSTYPGKEQPYPPQMTRYLDPVPLWTVATTATSRVRLNAQHAQHVLLRAAAPRPPADHARRAQRRPP
jgi:alkanesulfonate monooxygenase SsuD/methylene tetrahydromethanopterin reductase-like flavin-dependent oxidoreductase (luciferase family)